MPFNPVYGRHNYRTTKDADYFKPQREEQHASEVGGFAPDIAAEIETLEWCDVLIMQFPLWWFGLQGRVYDCGRWYDRGAFQGKRAMLSLTTGGPESIYLPDGLNGDINAILYPINHGIMRFTGFEVLPPFIAWSAAHVDDDGRQTYLKTYEDRLKNLATTSPIAYPSLDAYDPETYQLETA